MFYVLQGPRSGKFFVASEEDYRAKFSGCAVLCTERNKAFAWNEANRQNRRTERIRTLEAQVREREAVVSDLETRRDKLAAEVHALAFAVDFLKKDPTPDTAEILSKLETDHETKTADLAETRRQLLAARDDLDGYRRALRTA